MGKAVSLSLEDTHVIKLQRNKSYSLEWGLNPRHHIRVHECYRQARIQILSDGGEGVWVGVRPRHLHLWGGGGGGGFLFMIVETQKCWYYFYVIYHNLEY